MCADVAPTKYCYQYGWFSSNSDATVKAIPMLVFCWIVQICLIVDAIRLFRVTKNGMPIKSNLFAWLKQKMLDRPYWRTYDEKHLTTSRWRTRFRLDSGDNMIQLAKSVVILGTEFAFVALNVILITDYAHILIPNDFKTLNLKDWSLGQVIAVTIWVPVFLEYVYKASGE